VYSNKLYISVLLIRFATAVRGTSIALRMSVDYPFRFMGVPGGSVH
jgi:hypothetical protein